MPTASKAFQPFVNIVKANPVTLKLPEDSNTKLRIPNLHNIFVVSVGFAYLLGSIKICQGLDLIIHLKH